MKGWIQYTTVDEFAGDPTFRSWVASGQYGQESHPLTVFLAGHTDLIPLANEAADLLRTTSVAGETMEDHQLKEQIGRTWQKIRKHEERSVTERPTRQIWLRWVAAAVVILGIGLLWQESRKPAGVKQTFAENTVSDADPWEAFTNQGNEAYPLSLSDGSVVWLEPGSELRFPDEFDTDKREVILNGEAFFEVSKNSAQPFFVKNRDLITRVVGTSFLVKTLENNNGTVVQVRTGQVLVYRARPGKRKEEPVALQANQQLHVSDDTAELLTSPVQEPSVISERLNEQHFEFTDVPVSEVFNALSLAYGLPVEYDPNTFRNCVITTYLTDESLTEKLRILEETIGADTRLKLVDNKIQAIGAGCL